MALIYFHLTNMHVEVSVARGEVVHILGGTLVELLS